MIEQNKKTRKMIFILLVIFSISAITTVTATTGTVTAIYCGLGINCVNGSNPITTSGTINASLGTIILLSNQNTDTNLTSSGNCFTYSLQNNNYSQIMLQGTGILNGDNAGTPIYWNMSFDYGGVIKEETPIKTGAVITTSWILPATMTYSQAQTTSTTINFNSTEITNGGSFVCKSFSVWGII